MSSFEIKKILVPVDFSEAGEKALNHAIRMAKINHAAITLVHVVEGTVYTYDPDYFEVSKDFRDEYDTMLHNAVTVKMEAIKKDIKKQGVEEVEYYIETGKVYKKVIELAKSIKADIIIMGTHGVSGFKEFIMGSNTFRVVGGALCPVLSIQKKGKKDGFNSILLPFRDKAHSRESVDYAAHLAKLYGATIHLLGINIDPDKSALKKMQFEAEQTKSIIDTYGVECTIDVLTGDYISDLILSFAENKKADMIAIMSDLDRMSIREYVVGPVVQQIVNHSSIPVLSIHPLIKPKLISGGSAWSYWE